MESRSEIDPGRIPPASRGYLRTGGMFNSPERKYLDSNISVSNIPLVVPTSSLNIIPECFIDWS